MLAGDHLLGCLSFPPHSGRVAHWYVAVLAPEFAMMSGLALAGGFLVSRSGLFCATGGSSPRERPEQFVEVNLRKDRLQEHEQWHAPALSNLL